MADSPRKRNVTAKKKKTQLEPGTVRVTMLTGISGLRDGTPWPKHGESIDLPKAEGLQLIAQGDARPCRDEPEAETADAAPQAETVAIEGVIGTDIFKPGDEPEAETA